MKALLTAAKLVTLAVAVSLSLAPAAALALPAYDQVVIYQDAPGGNMIGQHVLNCTGATSSWGSTSPYYLVLQNPCDPEMPYSQCSNWPGGIYGACPF
jgi:hypothetical protein